MSIVTVVDSYKYENCIIPDFSSIPSVKLRRLMRVIEESSLTNLPWIFTYERDYCAWYKNESHVYTIQDSRNYHSRNRVERSQNTFGFRVSGETIFVYENNQPVEEVSRRIWAVFLQALEIASTPPAMPHYPSQDLYTRLLDKGEGGIYLCVDGMIWLLTATREGWIALYNTAEQSKVEIQIQLVTGRVSAIRRGIETYPTLLPQWEKVLCAGCELYQITPRAQEIGAAEEMEMEQLVDEGNQLHASLMRILYVTLSTKTRSMVIFPNKDVYMIWYHPAKHSINLQPALHYEKRTSTELFSLFLTPEGALRGVEYDGKIKSTRFLQEEGKETMHFLVQQVMEATTTYEYKQNLLTNKYYIHTILFWESLDWVIEYHLSNLSQLLQQHYEKGEADAYVKVDIQKPQLNTHHQWMLAETQDMGGVFREFFTLVVEKSLHMLCPVDPQTGLHIPSVPFIGESSLSGNVLQKTASPAHLDMWRSLGKLCMASYLSVPHKVDPDGKWLFGFTFGRRLSLDIFTMCFVYSARELLESFVHIKKTRLVLIGQAYLQAKYAENSPYTRIVQLLLQEEQTWNQEEIRQAAELLSVNMDLPDEWVDEAGAPNMVVISQLPRPAQEIYDRLFTLFMNTGAGANGSTLYQKLWSTWAFTQGMFLLGGKTQEERSTTWTNRFYIARWQGLFATERAENQARKVIFAFVNKAQGILDPKIVSDAIVIKQDVLKLLTQPQQGELRKKTQWIREIVCEVTPPEVEDLLRYFTGSPTFILGSQITISAQFLPHAKRTIVDVHICGPLLLLSPDPLDSPYASDTSKEGLKKFLLEESKGARKFTTA